MIFIPPHSVPAPPARTCFVKVRETEWIKVGHNKWVRVVIVKNERGAWHHGHCVLDPVRPAPYPKPTHIPTLKPTVKPTGHPTGKPKPTVKPTETLKPVV